MGTVPVTNWLVSQIISGIEALISITRFVLPLTSKFITVLTVRQFGLYMLVCECAQGYVTTATQILKNNLALPRYYL